MKLSLLLIVNNLIPRYYFIRVFIMNNLSDIITITNKISEKKNLLIILFLQMKTKQKNNWIFFHIF